MRKGSLTCQGAGRRRRRAAAASASALLRSCCDHSPRPSWRFPARLSLGPVKAPKLTGVDGACWPSLLSWFSCLCCGKPYAAAPHKECVGVPVVAQTKRI